MSSIASVLSDRESPYLVIDGSHRSVFAGILEGPDGWCGRSISEGAPLEQLFPAVRSALAEASLGLEEIRGFIYCAGPGSVLGLRLCAMAIETWRRIIPGDPALRAYNSMELTAALLRNDHAPDQALLVSDWKKGAWHAVRFNAGRPAALEVIDDASLLAWKGPLYHLPQRKGWQNPPENAITLDYAPSRIPEALEGNLLLTSTDRVSLYSSSSPTFQKWTPQRHRA